MVTFGLQIFNGELGEGGVIIAGAVIALMALSACDNGPSAVETRDQSADGAGAKKTAVTANRRETVNAKITRLYERNGADFGSRSPEDFLTKVKAFTESPPAGAETVKRPNADTLYYQASTDTFAVVSRDGTPRTMFNPDDGPICWAQQKERAPTFAQRRASSSREGSE